MAALKSAHPPVLPDWSVVSDPRLTRVVGFEAVLKRCLDVLLAAAALAFLSPLLFIIAFCVFIDSEGPVLYRRRVLGLHGKPFDALKFRTMIVDADKRLVDDVELRNQFEAQFKLAIDPRVTHVGLALRRSSLDELPQLWNVLRGQMSLVGPRMVAPDEAAKYGEYQALLVTVKPGITGPWQVQGRADLPYEARVRLSVDYIRNYSFWADVRILAKTIRVVLTRRGAY